MKDFDKPTVVEKMVVFMIAFIAVLTAGIGVFAFWVIVKLMQYFGVI